MLHATTPCLRCGEAMVAQSRFCGHCGHASGAPEEALVIGAGPNCGLVLRHATVSMEHARLTRLGADRYRIDDLASTNGLWVRGQRVQQAEVSSSESVQLGAFPLRIGDAARHLMPCSPAPSAGRTSRSLTVGREDADLQLPYPMISQRHLEVQLEGRDLVVRDLRSTNGTFVDNVRVVGRARVGPTSSLRLGSYRIPPVVLQSWRDQLGRGTASQLTLPTDGTLILGRDPDCDVPVEEAQVSWRHARIVAENGSWTIEDLGSANGTWLNGKRITNARLTLGDTLCLAHVAVPLVQAKLHARSPLDHGVRLDAREVVRTLPNGKTIVHGVSVSIYPGEFVAILGPSGAGKTTLLEMLTGQRRPTSGTVELDGFNLHDGSHGKARVGYVPQEDIMHRDLTVSEVLFHAAMLRLPADTPVTAAQARVDEVLTQMGLSEIRHSLIGGERVRGISGGQRKRVNIAIELLGNPPLLFLDEPTSGLDATSTLEVMSVLRALADAGTTVVATVHQPRPEAFELLDHTLLLAKGGHLAWFGPARGELIAHFETYGGRTCPSGSNPADFVVDCLEEATSTPQAWGKRYAQSATATAYVTDRQAARPATTPPAPPIPRRGWAGQYLTLTRRYSQRKLRDRTSMGIQLVQAPIIGMLIAWLFSDGAALSQTMLAEGRADRVTPALFLLSAAVFWLGCSNVARELVADRPVFRRDRLAGVASVPYMAAVTTVQSALMALQVGIMTGLVWGSVAVQADLMPAALCLVTTGLCGVSLGLLVSSVARTEVTALSVVPLLLLPQLMLAGYLRPYGNMTDTMSMTADGIPLRWTFSALCDLEYDAADVPTLLDSLGFDALGVVEPTLILAAMATIFLAAATARLHLLSNHGS